MQEHEIVLERGQEYDELGNVSGEWAHEVCAKCGERTDLMNSKPDCPADEQDMVTAPDSVFFNVLKSDKKTCTKERLLSVLSAIANLGITYEGQGGKTAYYGYDYEVGTGLRAPDMPLYYKPKLSRRAVLKHLEDKGMIKIGKKNEDEWEEISITEFGKNVLSEFHICDNCKTSYEWYNTMGFTQTSERSGYSHYARTLLCQCKKEEFEKRCILSKNSNNKMGLGEKITPKGVN